MTTARKERLSVNVAQAKQQFSSLVGRVAYAGATVVIMRRGQPMAKLVPVNEDERAAHLADVKGWLDDDDPLFAELDQIVAARSLHTPRVLSAGRPAREPGPRRTRPRRP